MATASRSDANIHEVNLVGGKSGLDFANTVYWRGKQDSEELLKTYEDLVDWTLRIGLIQPGRAEKLKKKAKSHPDEAENVRRRSMQLRELIYRIFAAHSEGLDVDEDDLDRLSFEYSRRMVNSKLVQGADRFQWKITSDEEALDSILVPILRSSVDLLTSKQVCRVKKCADVGCSWLFFDKSRNLSRRWCDMKDCGNRHKVKRFYKRAKKTPDPPK